MVLFDFPQQLWPSHVAAAAARVRAEQEEQERRRLIREARRARRDATQWCIMTPRQRDRLLARAAAKGVTINPGPADEWGDIVEEIESRARERRRLYGDRTPEQLREHDLAERAFAAQQARQQETTP